MKNSFLEYSNAVASAALAIGLNLSATAANPALVQDETVLQAMGPNAVCIAAQSGDDGSLRRLLDTNPRLIEQRDQCGSTLLTNRDLNCTAPRETYADTSRLKYWEYRFQKWSGASSF